jgi:hypothetical protein
MFILVEMKMVGLKSNVLKILFQILMSVKREFQGYKDMHINILVVLSAKVMGVILGISFAIGYDVEKIEEWL